MSNDTKGTKKSCPSVRPLAKARRSFAPVSIRGHCPPVSFATTYMQRVRLRRTALRATPRMNTSTQPPEGAGKSKARSKAAGELTLGLMSGEERRVYADHCRSLACQRWRPDSRPISTRCTQSNCGSEPARDDGLKANQFLTGVPHSLWELACQRWRPDSRPISSRCTPIPCGSWLASDDGLTTDPFLADVHPVSYTHLTLPTNREV